MGLDPLIPVYPLCNYCTHSPFPPSFSEINTMMQKTFLEREDARTSKNLVLGGLLTLIAMMLVMCTVSLWTGVAPATPRKTASERLRERCQYRRLATMERLFMEIKRAQDPPQA